MSNVLNLWDLLSWMQRKSISDPTYLDEIQTFKKLGGIRLAEINEYIKKRQFTNLNDLVEWFERGGE